MAEQEDEAHRGPRSGLASRVPARLFGEVRVPHQHVLRETDVGPEHGEREDQLPEVVIVLGRDRAPQRPGTLDEKREHGHQREEAEHASGEEVDAEDRAVPVRRQRHQVVEREKGDGEREQDQRGRARRFHLLGETGVPRFVLHRRFAVEPDRENRPNTEVNDRPREEERDVEPRLLGVQQVIGGDHRRIGPGVERAQAVEHGHREKRHREKNIRRDALGEPPHGDAPARARDVLHEDEKERTQSQRQKKDEAYEVRRVEAGPASGG